MDPAHGPFVHRAWWWRSAASIHEKTKRFEPIENGFRMSPHAPSSNSAPYKLLGKPVTTIDFVLPNRRYETITATNAKGKQRWFSSLTTVTPITASTCRIDVHRRVGDRLPRAVRAAHRAVLWREVRRARPADDDRAGAGAAVQPRAHAHRRRRQAGQVVLRAQAASAHRRGLRIRSAGRSSCTGGARNPHPFYTRDMHVHAKPNGAMQRILKVSLG